MCGCLSVRCIDAGREGEQGDGRGSDMQRLRHLCSGMPRGCDGAEAFQKRAGRSTGEEFVRIHMKTQKEEEENAKYK